MVKSVALKCFYYCSESSVWSDIVFSGMFISIALVKTALATVGYLVGIIKRTKWFEYLGIWESQYHRGLSTWYLNSDELANIESDSRWKDSSKNDIKEHLMLGKLRLSWVILVNWHIFINSLVLCSAWWRFSLIRAKEVAVWNINALAKYKKVFWKHEKLSEIQL